MNKKYYIQAIFLDDSIIRFTANDTNELQKQIKTICTCYNIDLIKVIQVINMDNLQAEE